jgi:Zn-dependent peptidase ImmA (M78 family)/transcriptional regulator with XRE-family HTH domain
MAESVRVEINPEVLRWARELGGFSVDDLARAVGTKPLRVQEWENGSRLPTMGQLRKIAWRLRRPAAFFLLAKVPEPDLPQPPDFRSAPDRHEPSIELRRELRAAVERRSNFLELVPDVAEWRPGIQLEDPVAAGTEVREFLGVTVEQQLDARDQYAALALWVGAIERSGALVFQSSKFDLGEARGASVHFPVLPVILLNAKDAPTARCFTVLHELGHLLMGSGALCEVYGQRLPRVERRCNQFAAQALMPADKFLEEFREPASDDQAVREAQRLGRRFKVSSMAAAIRLQELGKVDQNVVRIVTRLTNDRPERSIDDSPVIIPVSTLKLRDLGRSYVGAVLDAYHEDRITLTDASQFLDAKVPHIEKMEQRLIGPTGEGAT